ncbi:MAG: hypothetical protein NZL90_00910 [Aquificaceae bacterium]|nr:hypothetical protein [Aquificaceae bacterium]MDW8237580.1 hypothetical protein [Aquificaceae bacterium]
MSVKDFLLRVRAVFNPEQAEVIEDLIKLLDGLVKASDFKELKDTVKQTQEQIKDLTSTVSELAKAQARTEQRLEELAKAQARTEQRLEELAKAQAQTEEKLARLTEAMEKLAISVKDLNEKFGGISETLGYMLENEAYRMLPSYLERNYGIKLVKKFIRKEVGGKEINLLAEGEKEGKKFLILGEAKSKLSLGPERARDVLDSIEERINSALKEYPEYDADSVIKLIVTHFASESFIQEAKNLNYIVIQSFEW